VNLFSLKVSSLEVPTDLFTSEVEMLLGESPDLLPVNEILMPPQRPNHMSNGRKMATLNLFEDTEIDVR